MATVVVDAEKDRIERTAARELVKLALTRPQAEQHLILQQLTAYDFIAVSDLHDPQKLLEALNRFLNNSE